MTRKNRIKALDISEEDKDEYFCAFSEYEEEKDKSNHKFISWWLNDFFSKSQRPFEERYKPRQEVKCLFVLIGTSIELVLLSILTIRPKEKIYLISSSENKVFGEYISNALRQNNGGGDILNSDLFSGDFKFYLDYIKK